MGLWQAGESRPFEKHVWAVHLLGVGRGRGVAQGCPSPPEVRSETPETTRRASLPEGPWHGLRPAAALQVSVFMPHNYKSNLTAEQRGLTQAIRHSPERARSQPASACTQRPPAQEGLYTGLPSGATVCPNEGEKKPEYFLRPSNLRHNFKEKRWTQTVSTSTLCSLKGRLVRPGAALASSGFQL